MGQQRSKGRSIDGILLLDKPAGMTSNAALQKIKHLYNAKKAGHTGSLDPLASGMLPICLGQATKFSQFLLDANKAYRVIGKLGIKTTTGDAEGEIVAQGEVTGIGKEQIIAALAKFRGKIEQVPSMFSALKYKGQPLYKLARQGITVERQARSVMIYKLELLGFNKDLIELEIYCSKGTYIRTLVEDIGTELGCQAHVAALRRLIAEPYQEEQMLTLTNIQNLLASKGQAAIDALLEPIASIVADWQEVRLSEAAAYYLKQGQAIIAPDAPATGKVKLIMKDGRFLGIGEIAVDGKLVPKKIINL